MADQANIFANIPDELPQELVERLGEAEGVSIERIVSRGHATPPGEWYDQERNEWVVLLRGAAGLLFEGDEEPLELRPGDHVNIPAHRRHRVAWTAPDEDTVWLAVHYGAL